MSKSRDIADSAATINFIDSVTSNVQTQLDAKQATITGGTGIDVSSNIVSIDSTVATKTYADSAASTAVSAVIDAAPGTLDTLNELAAALGDDANFSTTVTNSIATKLVSSAVSAYGLTLIDDADAATARTTLGLGTAATTASTAYATAAQGATADSAVQNLADLSITATAAEINKLDGVTATTAELNFTDGVTSNIQTQLNTKAPLASATFTGITTVEAIRDTVHTLTTSTLLASNGGIQTKILSANTTFADSLSSGDAIVLQIENGATYTVTWPTITWVTSSGNSAPTLTAKDALVLWKVSSTLYGAMIGSYA